MDTLREKIGFFISVVSSMSLIDPSRLITSGLTGPSVQALGTLQGAMRSRQGDWGDTDNGSQFLAQTWTAGCQALGIMHEHIPVATPTKNAHIESWHSRREAECLRNQVFQTLAEAYTVTAEWIRFYNERRMHGRLQDWASAVY
ncbi:integrase core domain-containing protein [Sulfobacillus thermosulfidooxidans]|uniref:integrase core domain-containing protein n=1 Tax=Sulfobacillus thermosulfidooxidans TaxID=28034 RepID=UPI000A076F05|nr:integrase core domain-containing protein [Sulfobacillus thermosulfidooxidans]